MKQLTVLNETKLKYCDLFLWNQSPVGIINALIRMIDSDKMLDDLIGTEDNNVILNQMFHDL